MSYKTKSKVPSPIPTEPLSQSARTKLQPPSHSTKPPPSPTPTQIIMSISEKDAQAMRAAAASDLSLLSSDVSPRSRSLMRSWAIFLGLPVALVFLTVSTIVLGRYQPLVSGTFGLKQVFDRPVPSLSPDYDIHHRPWAHQRHHLESLINKRQDSDSEDSSSTPTSTSTASITQAPPAPSNPVLPTPFPQPFDATLSYDFVSGSCQLFFDTFTQDVNFRSCRAFSFLSGSSEAFFNAQSNLTEITAIMWGTCNTKPTETECVERMGVYEAQLRTECAAELEVGHQLTLSALNGFKNYEMMRKAGCLQNRRSNAYCYVEALAATTPSDIYFYQIPLGTPLPGLETGQGLAIQPTCSACVQSLMSVFAEYIKDGDLPALKARGDTAAVLAAYAGAADVVSKSCGGQYAEVIDSQNWATKDVTASMGLSMFIATLVAFSIAL